MTLIERLRNPSRVSGGALDEAQTLADMNESASAHEGEHVLRRALTNEIKRLTISLHEANDICRSAYQIAARNGAETNWTPFTERLKDALKRQHEIMYPLWI